MSEIGSDIERVPESISLYAGGAVKKLGDEKLSEIADHVRRGLVKNPYTMIGYTPEELIVSMKDDRASVIVDDKGELSAFAQYWRYDIDGTGDEFLAGEEVYEIGSWLRFAQSGESELGRKVFEGCLKVGQMAHPEAKFIAIVEESNARAAKLLEYMGGKEVGSKISKHVKTTESHPARMKIYKMSKNESA